MVVTQETLPARSKIEGGVKVARWIDSILLLSELFVADPDNLVIVPRILQLAIVPVSDNAGVILELNIIAVLSSILLFFFNCILICERIVVIRVFHLILSFIFFIIIIAISVLDALELLKDFIIFRRAFLCGDKLRPAFEI